MATILTRARIQQQGSVLPPPKIDPNTETVFKPRYFTGVSSKTIRGFADSSGTIWFVAKDILAVLDYPDTACQDSSVRRYFTSVPSNYCQDLFINEGSAIISVYCITERGLRSFINLLWQEAVSNLKALLETVIVPFFKHLDSSKDFYWNNYILHTQKDVANTVWFQLSDVLTALKYPATTCEHPESICKGLDQNSQTRKFTSISEGQDATFWISEDGLYLLLDESTKLYAKPYKNWIQYEVVPQCKGSYTLPTSPIESTLSSTTGESLQEEWQRLEEVTPDTPEMSSYKQAVALRVLREQSGGINRPMWLAPGRTITLDQLIIMIKSYWLDSKIDREQLARWLRQNGLLDKAYTDNNIITTVARIKGVFVPFTYTEREGTPSARLREDVKVTHIGVEYFTTLCAQGERFIPK